MAHAAEFSQEGHNASYSLDDHKEVSQPMKAYDLSSYDARLQAFITQLRQAGVAGFIVPTTDAFLNEYAPAHDQRLAWLTGFTGSNGMAVISENSRVLFTDGRYLTQAQQQLAALGFQVQDQSVWPNWLEDHSEGVWGFDPWLHATDTIERWQAKYPHVRFLPLDTNLVDALWQRQRPHTAPIVIQPMNYAGKSHVAKIAELQNAMGDYDAILISVPESVAWLLNIRGSDSETVPVAFVRALMFSEEKTAEMGAAVVLFADPQSIADQVHEQFVQPMPGHMATISARVEPDMQEFLSQLKGMTIGFDPATAPYAIKQVFVGAGVRTAKANDPCLLPKARKNTTELEGMRACHIADGVAVVRALMWLESQAEMGGSPTELELSDVLVQARSRHPLFRGVSFPTIAAAASNGAIIHYQPNAATAARLKSGDIVVIDSGGQYLNGTTDITRTVLFGSPLSQSDWAEQSDRFTRVLKGHIAVAQSCFPVGTRGHDLDILARWWLWQIGCDYAHGTGHGVGSYLNVHEGPQRISRGIVGDIALEVGMVVSNEPGYYVPGRYGIRIESLVAVVPVDLASSTGADHGSGPPDDKQPMLRLETLTLAPIDRRLINLDLLAKDEIAWLDAYHARVLTTLAPYLEPAELAWLRHATQPLVNALTAKK